MKVLQKRQSLVALKPLKTSMCTENNSIAAVFSTLMFKTETRYFEVFALQKIIPIIRLRP